MTCNTSAVAVCCSSASRVSVRSRAFSIAITACGSEVFEQSDLLVRERPNFAAMGGDVAEQGVVFPKRHHQEGSDTRHNEVHDQIGVGARTGARYGGGVFGRWSRVTSHIRDVD